MDHVLVGVQEVAQLLRVTRQRVDAIARSHTDFPEPVGRLAAGRIWRRSAILAWAKRNGRRVHGTPRSRR
jgi:hypothetical protein